MRPEEEVVLNKVMRLHHRIQAAPRGSEAKHCRVEAVCDVFEALHQEVGAACREVEAQHREVDIVHRRVGVVLHSAKDGLHYVPAMPS